MKVDQTTGFKTQNICAVPIFSFDSSVIGVIEIINKINSNFIDRDLKLLQSFASFSSVAFDNSRLRDSNLPINYTETELNKYLTEKEKKTTLIPEKLKLTSNEIRISNSLDFFAIEWNSLSLIKLLFNIFDKFNLLNYLKISNQILFQFLFEIRSYYNDVPYHNWIHVCDSTQYLSYLISQSNIQSHFSPLEITALIISSICHDVNHEGFNTIYNQKSEIPLSILYKDRSILESYHCSIAIQILTKDDTNLFQNLDEDDYILIWNLIIELILSTDMTFHFKILNNIKFKEINLKDFNIKLQILQLLLKTADISNVCRPFKITEKWVDLLYDEINDQNNNFDKQKSQIGFYNFICIPLYQILSKIFPSLSFNLENIFINLENWKKKKIV